MDDFPTWRQWTCTLVAQPELKVSEMFECLEWMSVVQLQSS